MIDPNAETVRVMLGANAPEPAARGQESWQESLAEPEIFPSLSLPRSVPIHG